MNDRELLEMAARAAGIDAFFDESAGEIRIVLDVAGRAYTYWNPLINDGDSLRLAVNLGLHIHVWRIATQVDFGDRPGPEEQHSNDPYAATRRAIVLAAAEIGKEMP